MDQMMLGVYFQHFPHESPLSGVVGEEERHGIGKGDWEDLVVCCK
jgi:hypothetical protein